MNTTIKQLRKDLRDLANPQKAAFFPKFFKTGKTEYGEGDQFIGVTVPHSRSIAKKYKDLPLEGIKELLYSPIHEERLTALFILVGQFVRATEKEQEKIYRFYLTHKKRVNNWDLVDSSADKIVGAYIYKTNQDSSILEKLAVSSSLWDRRIAMIATYYFIKQNSFTQTLHIADILLTDSHDLIHKAVGWMLREVGNRSKKTLDEFLQSRYARMPRTMLRYAIEKYPEAERIKYLKGLV
jgi:3-methyladenine DNA glycosylase AlkD